MHNISCIFLALQAFYSAEILGSHQELHFTVLSIESIEQNRMQLGHCHFVDLDANFVQHDGVAAIVLTLRAVRGSLAPIAKQRFVPPNVSLFVSRINCDIPIPLGALKVVLRCKAHMNGQLLAVPEYLYLQRTTWG